MPTFLSRFNVKADKESDFLELVKQLTAAVHADEPGCTQYQFYKRRDHPMGYAVLEAFVDQAAEEAHMVTPHFEKLGPPMVECLDGEYVREYLDDLA